MKHEEDSSQDGKIMIGISRMRNYLHRELNQIFLQCDLTSPRFSVLEVLYHKGDLSVGEIQESILGTPGNVPVIIKNLEKLGYVTRRVSKSDKRICFISLTESGMQKIKEVFPVHMERLHDLLSGFSQEEKDQLEHLLLRYKEISKEEII